MHMSENLDLVNFFFFANLFRSFLSLSSFSICISFYSQFCAHFIAFLSHGLAGFLFKKGTNLTCKECSR